MATQVKVPAPAQTWRRILLRIATVLATMFLLGLLLHHISAVMDRRHRAAGFFQGMAQGALMPAALPNLLVGNDVVIYAKSNTGVSYKLGYTLGVNVCGAFFFGMFFWRLNRWRKRGNGGTERASDAKHR